jgi:KUP system potassium uptake protein
MEVLKVATPAMKPYVIPLTLMVLVGLYLAQTRGAAGIGKWFGPISHVPGVDRQLINMQ